MSTPRPPSVRFAIAFGLAVLLAGCSQPPAEPTPPPEGTPTPPVIGGSGAPTVVPTLISSEITVGEERFLFSILDPSTNLPIAAPDREVRVTLTGPNGDTVDAGEANFVWAIEGERGIYVTNIELPTAGEWTAKFVTEGRSGEKETIPVTFPVAAESSALEVGEEAPSVETPTLDDVGGEVARLSTDADPLRALYETSVADALEAGRPFVLAFATPAFCQTAQCGPTLDRLKPFVERYPDVAFINVEPYELRWDEAVGGLQPVTEGDPPELQTVPAVDRYGILAEPWVYVVDGDGIVRGSFELIFSDAELEAALDTLR
jgi:hypothetical protein